MPTYRGLSQVAKSSFNLKEEVPSDDGIEYFVYALQTSAWWIKFEMNVAKSSSIASLYAIWLIWAREAQ